MDHQTNYVGAVEDRCRDPADICRSSVAMIEDEHEISCEYADGRSSQIAPAEFET